MIFVGNALSSEKSASWAPWEKSVEVDYIKKNIIKDIGEKNSVNINLKIVLEFYNLFAFLFLFLLIKTVRNIIF